MKITIEKLNKLSIDQLLDLKLKKERIEIDNPSDLELTFKDSNNIAESFGVTDDFTKRIVRGLEDLKEIEKTAIKKISRYMEDNNLDVYKKTDHAEDDIAALLSSLLNNKKEVDEELFRDTAKKILDPETYKIALTGAGQLEYMYKTLAPSTLNELSYLMYTLGSKSSK